MKTAIIIGAGPAGLTAAYELLDAHRYQAHRAREERVHGRHLAHREVQRQSHRHRRPPLLFEVRPGDEVVAGDAAAPEPGAAGSIADQLPEPDAARRRTAAARSRPTDPTASCWCATAHSRIYFLRSFFDYPIRLSADTLIKLGLARTVRIGISYLRGALFPITQREAPSKSSSSTASAASSTSRSSSPTRRRCGACPATRSAPSGARSASRASRITKTLLHTLRSLEGPRADDIAQKDSETSLIEQFLYPKFGPGQMWEEVAGHVTRRAARSSPAAQVDGDRARRQPDRVGAIRATHAETGETRRFEGDYFFSTMPVKELIAPSSRRLRPTVREVADGLIYRDFITVGLLLQEAQNPREHAAARPADPRQLDLHPGARTSTSAGCRFSTTGARTWWPIPTRSGSGSSTSATKATRCGESPMRR